MSSKTPEELAKDASAEWIKHSETNNSLADACAMYGYGCGFLAGYKAAQEKYEARIKELEIELDNWKHEAIHGDEGL